MPVPGPKCCGYRSGDAYLRSHSQPQRWLVLTAVSHLDDHCQYRTLILFGGLTSTLAALT